MFETDHKQWRKVNNLKTNIVYNSTVLPKMSCTVGQLLTG